MNVLVDAHVFDEPHQGSRTYIKGLYSSLIDLMPDTNFFFAAQKIEALRLEMPMAVNVHFVQLRSGRLGRLLIEFPFIIRRYKIHYAHFQYVSPPLKVCKYIVTTHDILFKDFRSLFPLKYRVVKNFLFRFSARTADILLTVSEYSRERIAHHYRIESSRITVTPNGVSDYFAEPVSQSEIQNFRIKYDLGKYILCVSRIEPRKNHINLLLVYQSLQLWKRGIKLVLIGKKDFGFSEFDALLKNSSELRNNTLILQGIDELDLKLFYKNALLFVYPSLAEGFGLPPIEAVSTGTPVLCSNSTAMADFRFLGEDLFDPQDSMELKRKIENKLERPDSRSRMTELQKVISEKYDWHKSAERLKLRLLVGRQSS